MNIPVSVLDLPSLSLSLSLALFSLLLFRPVTYGYRLANKNERNPPRAPLMSKVSTVVCTLSPREIIFLRICGSARSFRIPHSARARSVVRDDGAGSRVPFILSFLLASRIRPNGISTAIFSGRGPPAVNFVRSRGGMLAPTGATGGACRRARERASDITTRREAKKAAQRRALFALMNSSRIVERSD